MTTMILGLDFDDVLSLEYCLMPASPGTYTIEFRGELFNYLKSLVLKSSAKHIFISSYSARQSVYLDAVTNSTENVTIFSAQALHALTRQLSQQTRKPVILDMSLLDNARGLSFQKMLHKPLDCLEEPFEITQEALITKAKRTGYLMDGEGIAETLNTKQQYLKLLRARQMTTGIITHSKDTRFELFLFDDKTEYLDCIFEMFTLENVGMTINTILVDAFENDYMQDHCKLVPQKIFPCQRQTRKLTDNFSEWICPSGQIPFPQAYQEFNPDSAPLLISEHFIRALETACRHKNSGMLKYGGLPKINTTLESCKAVGSGSPQSSIASR